MAIVVHEKNQSRPLKEGQETTYEFFVTGTNEASEAIEAVKQYISVAISPPAGMAALPPVARIVKSDSNTDNSRIDVSVDYVNETLDCVDLQRQKNIEEYSRQLSFNFSTGNSQQMYVANSSRVYPSSAAPDFGDAINVQHDSDGKINVMGLNVEETVGSFSVTVMRPSVTVSYLRTVCRTVGRVNSGSIWGFEAGELRFMGASGSQNSPDGPWTVTYNFAVSENQTNLTIGGISGITKKGWEYLWPYFEYSKDETAKIIVKKPKHIFVQEIFKTADFSQLKITNV